MIEIIGLTMNNQTMIFISIIVKNLNRISPNCESVDSSRFHVFSAMFPYVRKKWRGWLKVIKKIDKSMGLFIYVFDMSCPVHNRDPQTFPTLVVPFCVLLVLWIVSKDEKLQ